MSSTSNSRRSATCPDLGDEAGVVESVKARFGHLLAGIWQGGRDKRGSRRQRPRPSMVSPYGDGWFFKIKLSDPTELDELLDAEDYQEVLDAEAE